MIIQTGLRMVVLLDLLLTAFQRFHPLKVWNAMLSKFITPSRPIGPWIHIRETLLLVHTEGT